MSRPAIFIDRDGVLNDLIRNPATGRMEAPLWVGDFHLIDGVTSALLRLQSAGYALILVSNQPNFALGKSSYDAHWMIHHELVRKLALAGVRFTRFSYCLHHPKGLTPGYSHVCDCRKPSPGMLLQARDDFSLTLADSWMIGDQPTDTQCGRAAGTRTIRVVPQGSEIGPRLDPSDPGADHFARNLCEAAEIILGDSGNRLAAGPGCCESRGVDGIARGPRIVVKHLHGLQRVLL